MSTATNTKSISFYIHIAITLGLMLFFDNLVAPFGAVTPMGMKVLGIFLGMMWGWIFCDLVWPSLLGTVLLGLTGYDTVYGIMGTFFNTTILQVLFLFMIAGLFEAFGVTSYLAGKIMSAKFIVGHPWKMAAMIFIATAVIANLVDVIPAIFLMWAIYLKAAEDVGCSIKGGFSSFVVAGVVIAGAISGMILPFKATALAYMGFSGGLVSIDQIPVVTFIVWATVYTTFIMAVYMVVGKFVLKLDVSKFENGGDVFAEMRGQKATKIQKIGLVIISAFLLMLLWPSIMPAEWAITQTLKNLSIIGVVTILLTIGYFVKDDNGKPVITTKTVTKGIGWEMVFLLAATYPMAAALRVADCGIMATVNMFVRPVVMAMGPTTMVVISVLLLGLLTQITHNGVLAAMFMPFLLPMYQEMGGNLVMYWILIYFVLQAAFSTPAASMYSGMIFGHDSCSGSKDGYIFGIVVFIAAFIALLVSMPLLNAMM